MYHEAKPRFGAGGGECALRLVEAHALVAQRIEHLTTDRCSIYGVLTCENPPYLLTVCAESKLKIRRVAGLVLGLSSASAEETKPYEATSR